MENLSIKWKFLYDELRGFAPIGALEYWSYGFKRTKHDFAFVVQHCSTATLQHS